MQTELRNNKYRNVLMMVQRAKQLQNGARPRVQMPGSRSTRIAREEVEKQLIEADNTPESKDKR